MSSSSISDQTPAARRSPERSGIDRSVLLVSVALATVFVLWGVVFTENLASVAAAVLAEVISMFGSLFVLASAGFLILAVVLALSRFGRIRLGGDDERPEFRTVSWVAMMFSAGMGIGLMFWGVSEPISHFITPPPGGSEPGTEEAALTAMEYSYFHWAAHPWAMYAVVGLALAYFGYRKGERNLISVVFRPILGDRVDGPIGKAVEILAIFATLFGSATSLGLGALQINSGLNYVWGIENSTALAIVIIAVLTVAFIASACSGVSKGIQWLSNANMVLAVAIIVFVLVAGPTIFIINTFTESIGGYLTHLPSMSFKVGAFGGSEWLAGWTIFYWAWWISWSPFVGSFIARISRGRTIREFVLGVILAPSLVSFIWFSVLGGTALNLELGGSTTISDAVAEGPEAGLFATLTELPLFTVTSIVVIILVALFFVSGADAASIVLGMLSCRGTLSPSRPVVILWGTLTGLTAAVLLLAGGLNALQQVTIIAAFPFMLVMIGMCWSLVVELRKEPKTPTEPDIEAVVDRATLAAAHAARK